MLFVSLWYFMMYLIDIILDYIEKGTQKLKKIKK